MAVQDDYENRFASLALLAYQAAFRLTGDRQGSEDVAQETTTRAYTRWSRVQSYAEAWVVRVATNQVIGTWRKRPRPIDLPGPPENGHDDHVATRLALTEALRSLPRRQRQVAVLRYLGDLSIEATADALGCSASSVKVHSARALVALRRHEALSADFSTSSPTETEVFRMAVISPDKKPEPPTRLAAHARKDL